MKDKYDNVRNEYKSRFLTDKEKKDFVDEVQRFLRPIFMDIDKTLMNNPYSNFTF